MYWNCAIWSICNEKHLERFENLCCSAKNFRKEIFGPARRAKPLSFGGSNSCEFDHSNREDMDPPGFEPGLFRM